MPRTLSITPNARNDDARALSNVLWVLIFFGIIVVFSIAGAMFGFSALENASGGDNRAAAQAGMANVRADMYDIAGGAPYRTTTVDVEDGALTYGEPIKIEITATTGGDSMATQTIRPTPIVYTLGDTRFVFVSGAVFLQQPNGEIIKEDPSFRISEKQAIIPLINTTHHDGPKRVSVDGDGKVYVTGHKWNTSATRFEPTQDGDPVEATATIRVQTPRTKMWRSWFEQRARFSNVQVDEGTNTVTAEFSTKRLYVRTIQTRVKLDI